MNNVINLPIVGKIQHGEQQKVNNRTKVVELKHFIAKVRDEELKGFEKRFSEIYPKQNKIEVRFISENPLTVKQARYNQGGLSCYCMDGESKRKAKSIRQMARN